MDWGSFLPIAGSLKGTVLELPLSLLGPVMTLFISQSSVSTAWHILKMKTVGKLPLIPFVCLFTSGAIWSIYGFYVNDVTIFWANCIAALSGVLCMLVYQAHSGVLLTNIGLYTTALIIISYCFMLAIENNLALVGFIGDIVAIVLFASPLSVIRTVLTDRSTAAMPFMTSLSTWLNTFVWSVYGYFVSNDAYVYVPNLIGLALASAQLMLYLIYGLPPSSMSGGKTYIASSLLPQHAAIN